MSYTHRTAIWCDAPDCNSFYVVAVSQVFAARQAAAANGWSCQPGWDYCPLHAEREPETLKSSLTLSHPPGPAS